MALLDALERDAEFPGAARIGVTGAPGAGKSTLLDALVRGLRRRERTVAVVAVDPSSQRTGGALLGDRIRMRSGAGDPGVFIRSMAARDRLGGLAESTWAAVSILSACFRSRLRRDRRRRSVRGERSRPSPTPCSFVANPGGGDTLQFMKAGILELPDVFAVNKADTGAIAERTAHELEAGLRLTERDPKAWQAPVKLVSARDATGIGPLLDVLDAHRERGPCGGYPRRASPRGKAPLRRGEPATPLRELRTSSGSAVSPGSSAISKRQRARAPSPPSPAGRGRSRTRLGGAS